MTRNVILGVLAAAATAVATMLLPPPPAHASLSCGGTVTGPFHEANARIYDANGNLYVAHGITVSGLESANWRNYTSQDDAEIDAAATAWCANTVRFQVSVHYMLTDSGLAAQLSSEVSRAEAAGMVAVINANDEWDPNAAPMPTSETKDFWRKVAPAYANDPQVVFDLFNEPRAGRAVGWACWRNGRAACPDTSWVGMNALAGIARFHAPHTLLWADCNHSADSCAGVPRLGAAGPLAYSIHHPTGPHTPSNWWHQFGYLQSKGIAPVVAGEWTNWAAARGECWSDAPTAVPSFLQWMDGMHIGMTVWTLALGQLTPLTGSSLDSPTTIGSGWKCVNGLNQSAGALIKAQYAKGGGS